MRGAGRWVLARADIDGILFQDGLVLETGKGFSPEAVELDRAFGAAAPGVSLAFVRGLEDRPLDIVRRHFER